MAQIRKLISQGSMVSQKETLKGAGQDGHHSLQNPTHTFIWCSQALDVQLSPALGEPEPLSVPLACNAQAPAGSFPPL